MPPARCSAETPERRLLAAPALRRKLHRERRPRAVDPETAVHGQINALTQGGWSSKIPQSYTDRR